jgi:hypothetical protein
MMARVHVMGGYLNVEGMSGGYPGNELPGVEGPVDPGYGISSDRPAHPIVIPPDAIGPGLPSHPIYLPVYPGHPIVLPPDAIGPGLPSHPIYIPVYPQHPIVIPPDAVGPGQPEHPIVLPIYPAQGLPPFASHPIVIPPEAIVPGTDGKAHVVVYANGQRIAFTVEMTPKPPPTEAAPKR